MESFFKAGGMGSIFKGRSIESGEVYALKILHKNSLSQEVRQRFIREMAVLLELEPNPHIVRVRDWGLGQGVDFIAMDFLEGLPLNHAIKESPRPPLDWIGLFIPFLQAVHELHLKKIIHRDLKPENIILCDNRHLVLIDFGLSKIFGKKIADIKTRIVGTPPYMSPEQLEGKKNIDHLTDLWSLGVILYEILSGSHPFPHKNPRQLAQLIRLGKPRPLFEVAPSLPRALWPVIRKSLMNSPLERHQSVGEMAKKLERILQ